jgi:hypothetical protein
VRGGVPGQRVVATPDVPARCASPQVHPPSADVVTLDATRTTRRDRRVYRIAHERRAYRRGSL